VKQREQNDDLQALDHVENDLHAEAHQDCGQQEDECSLLGDFCSVIYLFLQLKVFGGHLPH